MMIIEVFILSAFVGRVATELHESIHREAGLAWNSKRGKKKLISLLKTLNSVLQEVEEKSTYSQAMLQWLQKIHNIADDALILLNSFPSAPYFNMKARGIRNILQKFDDLLKEKSFIFNTQQTLAPVAVEKETDPSLPHSTIYERESAKEEIVKFLLDNTCPENISVIPIVGIPGIGKTTLAKLVYNDERVIRHFGKGMRKWVWLPGCLDVKKIVEGVLESPSGISREYSSFYAMKTVLQNELHGKKFLLVLDNVYNESGNWEELSNVLKVAKHGSKIVVTTSNNRVAKIVRTTMPYKVEGLTEPTCWLIFERLAFLGEQNTNKVFLEVGRNIAKKSKGVPCAAEDLGRLMMHKDDDGEWHDTASREIWNFSEEKNQILPMLRLSYKDLPSYAYRCFAYCSIFPRNYEISKDTIIRHWIAHDFISSEDQGREALNHLLDRFFFEPLQKDEDGSLLIFKLHELIYDLARYEMKTSISRHICSNLTNMWEEYSDIKYWRTYSLLNSSTRYMSEGPRPMINQLTLLRVLDMSYTRDTSFINLVGELHQLRFLNLSGTDIETLPNSIRCLSNLQSLILRNCSKLKELPTGTWKTHSLRHLDIEGCGSLDKMPPALGQLTSLQTLPIFIVGRKGSSVGELGTLNLQGRLHIKCLGNVANIEDVYYANLKEKERLTTLSLSWDDDSNRYLIVEAAVLNALQPHYYLSRLSIVGYGGRGFPDWLNTAYLQNLTGITLSNCRRCVHLPPLGELPSLKSLAIEGFDSAVHIGKSLYGVKSNVVFPSLEKFICSFLKSLTDWGQESRVLFPNLSVFCVKKCPKLKNIPRLHSMQNKLEHLEIEDCPHINSVEEINSLHAMKTLKIVHCEGLMNLPQGLSNLNSLVSLEIDSCLSLTCIPLEALHGLRSLQYLLIQKCEKLTLVDGLSHLISLRKLKINGCQNLQLSTTGRQCLKSLQFLTIQSCPKLIAFPWGPLKDLHISSCSQLFKTSTWAENLTLLESLTIENCNNLTVLPSQMKTMVALKKLQIVRCHDLIELPGWLTSLASLQYLNINYCYLLKHIPDELRLQRISMHVEGCYHLNEWYAERSRSWKRTSESKRQLVDIDAFVLQHSANMEK